MPTTSKSDHRSRVGAQRRERTRKRLIESAMTVFARRGVEASVIDEVIAAAGVARGTFYNHFRGNEDLLAAVAQAVSDEMLRIVDPIVRAEADPAARVATGIRLILGIAREYPQLAAFMVRGGPPAIGTQGLAVEYLPRDLAAGVASGAFSPVPPRLAFDLVTGAVLAGFHTLLTRRVAGSYAEDMASMILRALGLTGRSAGSIARRRIAKPQVGPDSLLARAEAVASAARPRPGSGRPGRVGGVSGSAA